MMDEEVTAALASVEPRHEDVEDPPANVPTVEPHPVTVEDVHSDHDDDSIDRYRIRTRPWTDPVPPPRPEISVRPYISQRHVRYKDDFP